MSSIKNHRLRSGPEKSAYDVPTPLVRTCINQLCELASDLIESHGLNTPIGSEASLCLQLDLSRTPLREALAWLCRCGVLERMGRTTRIIRAPKRTDTFIVKDEETRSKAERCEQWILKAIAERRLLPGQRFTEVEVAEAAEVTIATVREVLARYETRRLIEKDPRRSWRMISFNQDSITELWEIRRLVETHALTRLCQELSTEQLAQSNDLLERHHHFEKAKRWRINTFRQLDRQFHQLIFAACANQFIEDLRSMIDLLIHVQLADDEIGREGMSRGLREHIQILEAIVQRDSQGAQAALSAHMDSSEYIMNQALMRNK